MQENSAGSFVRYCSLADLKPGSKRVETIGDREVGIFNVDGVVYAIDDVCPHVDGPLHSGPVDSEKKSVTCPLHAWEFSLVDGTNCEGRRAVIDTFAVSIRDGDVYIASEPNERAAPPPRRT